MNTKIKIPPSEIKKQTIEVKLTATEISKIKAFCKDKRVTQNNLIRYAIRCYIPNL